jgi:hypothetical protein
MLKSLGTRFARWLRLGSSQKLDVRTIGRDRLLPWLLQSVEILPWSGCWIWMKRVNENGYAVWTPQSRKYKDARVHRLLYELLVGEAAEPMLCHRCDIPCCVNPAHLFPGDQMANMGDAAAKKRTARGEGHGRRKLNLEQVEEIRSSIGLYADIGARYGVSPITVGRIKRGQLWK